MKAFVNFGGIFLIVLLAAIAVAAYRFFKNSDPDNLDNDPDVNQEEFEKERKNVVQDLFKEKKKKIDGQETVLTNMPVLSWKYPGGDWNNKEISKVHTVIGRGSDCDIVINHPTVSMKHAEISMKIRKINAQKKGAKYFLLKNHSKENPISFLNAEGGADDWRDIVKSIPLTYTENAFFLGLVEMRVTFPAKKHVLSEGPVLYAEEEKKPEQNSELLRVQRKVIRRSPRSGNRI